MAARSAAGRGVRTAYARIAGSTAVARSCMCTTTNTITITDQVVVAVDVNGADLGPVEVARGAARAAAGGIRVLLFGPASSIGAVGEGVSVIDAPVSIAKDPDPARAVRRTDWNRTGDLR